MRLSILVLVLLGTLSTSFGQNAVGNVVYMDDNNNGMYDASEGVAGVTMELLVRDQSNNHVLQSSTTTDANGFYYFDNVANGRYKIRVAASNFASSGPLTNERSVGSWDSYATEDSNDNGTDGLSSMGILSQEFQLEPGTAPTGEDQSSYAGVLADEDVNATIDFGFKDFRTLRGACSNGGTELELDWNQFDYSTANNTTTIGGTTVSIQQVSNHNASSDNIKYYGDKDQGYGYTSSKTLEIYDFFNMNGQGSLTFTFSPAVENVTFSVYGLNKSDVVEVSGNPTLTSIGHSPTYMIAGNTITGTGEASSGVNNTLDVAYDGMVSSFTVTYTMSGGIKPEFIALSNITFCQPVVLPVELSKLDAREMGSKVMLDWETESEIDNDRFVIQRMNRAQNFESIGEVAGQGQSTYRQAYSFLDDSPLNGQNLYRLKQIDYDGSVTYSDVVAVDIDLDEEVAVYPTVTQDRTTIEARGSKTVNVFDLNGNLIAKYMEESGRYNIDLSPYPSGIYIASIHFGHEVINKRIIKN